jgi:HSP20 family molecular chaperone IbpA
MVPRRENVLEHMINWFGRLEEDIWKTAVPKPEEDDENWYINLDLKGFGENDVEISCKGDQMTVSARSQIKSASEFSSTSREYQESFPVRDVVLANIKAEMEGSRLRITLPKDQDALARRAVTLSLNVAEEKGPKAIPIKLD